MTSARHAASSRRGGTHAAQATHLGVAPRPDRGRDLSRLLEHSSTRVTQDRYIHVRDDMFDHFYDATA